MTEVESLTLSELTCVIFECRLSLRRLVERALLVPLKANKSIKKVTVSVMKDQEEVEYFPIGLPAVRLRPADYRVQGNMYDVIRLGTISPPRGYVQPILDAKSKKQKDVKQQKIEEALT